METPDLLNSSEFFINPYRFLIKSQWVLGANKTPQLQGVTLTPTIYISNSSHNTPALNVNETPVISKSGNLSCIPYSTKSQNLNKHQKEQTIIKTENMGAKMIVLKSFVVDQIYMVKKRPNAK